MHIHPSTLLLSIALILFTVVRSVITSLAESDPWFRKDVLNRRQGGIGQQTHNPACENLPRIVSGE